MPGGLGGQALLPQSFFLVLEGGEGSGKTSILAALSRELGDAAVFTREPGGTPEGLSLRGLLLASGGFEWDAGAELLLMVAARVQHVKQVIAPALAAGRVVVCDRFLGSTLAYQGAGRGLPESVILDLHERFVGRLRPDLTVLLDVNPRVGLARSARRLGEAGVGEGRFEALDLAFHDRVRSAFLVQAAAEPGRSLVVDAGRPLGEVTADVLAAVRRALVKPGGRCGSLGHHK